MKKGILFFVLVAFEFMGAFAQTYSLDEGVYKTAGSADEMFVNADRNYNRNQKGYYTIELYYGSAKRNKASMIASGTISGDELRVTTNSADLTQFAQYMGIDASDVSLPNGTLFIFEISDNKTFYDGYGQRWIWMRARK